MYLEPNIELQKRLLKWSRFLLSCVIIIAAVLLLGHLLNIHFLIQPLFGSPPLGFLSAFCFLLCTISIAEVIFGNGFQHNHSMFGSLLSWVFALDANAPTPLISALCFTSSSI